MRCGFTLNAHDSQIRLRNGINNGDRALTQEQNTTPETTENSTIASQSANPIVSALQTSGLKRSNEDSSEELPAKRRKIDNGKAKEEEDCCVCRDRKIKYTLKCTAEHGFCHSCIENWALEKGQTFSCPCCREECTLPDDWWASIRHLARTPTDSETEDDYASDLSDTDYEERFSIVMAMLSNDENSESESEHTLSMQCDALQRRSDALTIEQASLQREIEALRRQNEALTRRHDALRRRRDALERRALALRQFINTTDYFQE